MLKINGTQVKNLYYNGNAVKKAYYNDNLIYSSNYIFFSVDAGVQQGSWTKANGLGASYVWSQLGEFTVTVTEQFRDFNQYGSATNNVAVNLSKYKKMIVKYYYNGNGWTVPKIGVYNTLSGNNPNNFTRSFELSAGEHTAELDVSTLSGNYYFKVGSLTRQNNATNEIIRVYSVEFEE